MTVTTYVEKWVRRDQAVPVDYDATSHVVTAAATVLRRQPRTDRQAQGLFLLVHWGYGSSMAALHTAAVRELGWPRPWAALTFFGLCQGMAFTLFPLLGGTPVPWRWRRDIVVSSIGQHLVYVTAVATADRLLAESVDPIRR